MTAPSQDLREYLRDYNTDRAHTGRLTQGRVPWRDDLTPVAHLAHLEKRASDPAHTQRDAPDMG
jgi:hypothetical protein